MHAYSTGTSRNRVAKLSLRVRALGWVTAGRTPAGQDAAAEFSIFCTAKMTSFRSGNDMINDYDMPLLIYSAISYLIVSLSRGIAQK